MHGGVNDGTWAWDGVEWTVLDEDPRMDVRGHWMVYDQRQSSTLLFGGIRYGSGSTGYSNDLFQFRCPLALSVTPTCPGGGPVHVEWSGAVPNAYVALIFARNVGSFVIPDGNICAGAVLGLGALEVKLVYRWRSDENGTGRVDRNATAHGCGGYLQLIDLHNCTTSNVVRME